LQTAFAPVPERSRGENRPLAVIIVANPAPDASLPGAQREARAVAQLIAEHRPDSNIKLLEGHAATRANLAKELCNHPYDILHYAGHCCFNPQQPGKSGWIFRRDPPCVFSADELLRMDRVPSFVFSNACESGITPDRADEANRGLGPAFAEAFFAKGVCNFICTAWPVDDDAAMNFARVFYQQILVHEASFGAAVIEARLAAWTKDPRTAGAYQHYGDPSFRIPRAAMPPAQTPTK
jgi:CHAT domain-containing protein